MLAESTLVFVPLAAIFAYSFYAVLVAGQLSLGQAGFAALAGFTAAALAPAPGPSVAGGSVVSVSPLGAVVTLTAGIAIGIVVGALAALLLGLPTMHLRGVFLAIATLGFAEAVRVLLVNAEWTGGAGGMTVPKLVTPGVAWVCLTLVAYWFWRQRPSRYGRALAAIREDELAARMMGIDVGRHRLAAFVSAGAIAGLYGVLWAYFVRLLAPEDFSFTTAIDGLVTTVVGGATVWLGPVLGGALLTVIPEVQRAVGVDAGWLRPFLAGLLLLMVILFLPGGLAGLLPRWRTRRGRAKADTETGAEAAGEAAGRGGQDAGQATEHEQPAEDGVRGSRARPAAGEPIVELLSVGKDYGGVHALRDVDLVIRAGEVVGLIGPNGAGKTTLVNLISGLDRGTTGSIEVLGTRPGRTPVHQVAAAGVSRTFQHSKLFLRLSALENVLAGAHRRTPPTFLRRLLWLPSARRDEQRALRHAAACLRRVGLAERADQAAGTLSYGDQRRLEIARALAAEPALLILDEPAAGMNQSEADRLSDLIADLAGDGLTVLLIEHNVAMVRRSCDRLVVLDFGVVIASGDPERVLTDPAVLRAYLGETHEEYERRAEPGKPAGGEAP